MPGVREAQFLFPLLCRKSGLVVGPLFLAPYFFGEYVLEGREHAPLGTAMRAWDGRDLQERVLGPSIKKRFGVLGFAAEGAGPVRFGSSLQMVF